jgi:hypothetical protein
MLLQIPHTTLSAVILDEYIDSGGLEDNVGVLQA